MVGAAPTVGTLAADGFGLPAASPWSRTALRLTVLMAVLLCIGSVMVASAAGASGFLEATTKRLALMAAGVAAFIVGSRTPYAFWRRHSFGVLVLSLTGLALTLVPGVGACINGARRWISTGLPVGFQPSEFAKVGLCIWTAAYCERNAARMGSILHGFFVPLSVAGFASLLILAEPDFGTAVLTGSVCLGMLLVFGARLLHVVVCGVAGLPLLQHLVLNVPYRRERVLAFLNPWQDPQGSGYQLIQSKIAIGSGRLLGRGLGAGVQKAGFLPSADNDFIFSILAEELGLVGCLLVLALFALLLWEVLKVVLRGRDPFSFALATGLGLLLGVQAAAHVAVVTGSVPTKGLSLPFISAGGSSLMASMFAVGVLVNIARSQEQAPRPSPGPWEDDVPGYEQWAYRVGRGTAAACAQAAGDAFERLRTKYGR